MTDAYSDVERQLAWAYLSRLADGPDAAIEQLIRAVGPVDAAYGLRNKPLPKALIRLESRRVLDCAADDLAILAELGGRLITPDDEEWPAWRMLSFSGAGMRNEQDGAGPIALWAYGTGMLANLVEQAVAIVGTRAPTIYGDRVTSVIGGELSQQGWTLVSGAAFGIDAAAHRTALANAGATVGVLACGIDQVYPRAHERLIRRIAENGLIVSEYPPGVGPLRHRFLQRNRLIAALSGATVVIEAGRRSGARNTAKWARRLGLPVLAVPGSVESAASVGCHEMIASGEAVLITNSADVLAQAGPTQLTLDGIGNGRFSPDSEELQVLSVLSVSALVSSDEIVRQSGLEPRQVSGALTRLELGGQVSRVDGQWWRSSA